MDKSRKILILAAVAAVVGGLMVFGLYIVCDFIVMGSVISKNQINYVQSSTAPPTNYKSNFGVWTISYDKEKDAYSSTLTVPTAKSTISKYMAGGSIAGTVVDTEQFEQALANSSVDEAIQITYYKGKFETFIRENPGCNADGIEPVILATATYANLSSEGKTLQWENNIHDKPTAEYNDNIEEVTDDGYKYYKYNCSCGESFYFAVHTQEGWYTTTREQFENAYKHAKKCYAFTDDSIGFGAVQWTWARATEYIIYMWENCIEALPTDDLQEHYDKIKDVEASYICKDINDYLTYEQALLSGRNKSDITLPQLTAYIAGVYENPYYCFRYQRTSQNGPVSLVKKNKSTDEITTKAKSYYPSYTTMYTSQCESEWDFDNYFYYWVDSSGSEVADMTESYRVDKATKFYLNIVSSGIQ